MLKFQMSLPEIGQFPCMEGFHNGHIDITKFKKQLFLATGPFHHASNLELQQCSDVRERLPHSGGG